MLFQNARAAHLISSLWFFARVSVGTGHDCSQSVVELQSLYGRSIYLQTAMIMNCFGRGRAGLLEGASLNSSDQLNIFAIIEEIVKNILSSTQSSWNQITI